MSSELRPHHILCLLFFEGKGYSDGFTAHMAAFHEALASDPVLRLKAGEDVLCGRCPNQGTGCPGAAAYDGAVLSLCGLTPGEERRWSELAELAREKILRPGKLESVCGECQWAEICREKAKHIQ